MSQPAETMPNTFSPEVTSPELTGEAPLRLLDKESFITYLAAEAHTTTLATVPIRRASSAGGNASVWLDTPPKSDDEAREECIRNIAAKFARDQWWMPLDEGLGKWGFDERIRGSALQLLREHTFEIEVNGHEVGSATTVYECGPTYEDALNEQELEHLRDTLTILDQFTGGTLTHTGAGRRLAFIEGVTLPHPKDGRREIGGFIDDELTIINLSYIRRMAREHGADFSTLLAVTLAHEMVGHQREHQVTRKAGAYLLKHFDYSKERVPGDMYPSVHAQVTPKSPEHSSSKPVRTYGYVNSAEDLASSVDTYLAHIMGWEAETAKVPWLKSTPDEYRAEIVEAFLQEQVGRSRKGDRGLSASITYHEDEATGELSARPRKAFVKHTKESVEAAQDLKQRIDAFWQWEANRSEIIYEVSAPKAA